MSEKQPNKSVFKSQDDDPFEDLFNLEDHHYEEGYKAGFADGAAQSALETRIFGIEKGFEKFLVMGKLRRQAEVWADRYGLNTTTSAAEPEDTDGRSAEDSSGEKVQKETEGTQTAQSAPKTRLQRHVETLLLLTDSATLDMSNSDEAVAIFDDRLKRAQAKVKVVESIVGEDTTTVLGDRLAGSLTVGVGTSGAADIENLKLKPG